jgi:hypothetical protein
MLKFYVKDDNNYLKGEIVTAISPFSLKEF